MRFNALVNEVLTNVSNTKFSNVVTHDYESKIRVKQLQNEFIFSKIPSRDASEILFGVVGNAEGLQAHLQEYKELGFSNPGQLFIFENQSETYSKLRKATKSLGVCFVDYTSSTILTDSKAANCIKLYNNTLNIDLKNNLYPAVIRSLIPHISPLDFDVVGRAPSVDVLAQSVQEYFNYPATKSIVIVCAMSRARGGGESENTKIINSVFDELLNTVCVYRDKDTTTENTLNYFITQLADIGNNIEHQREFLIKKKIRQLLSISKLGASPIKVYLEDLSNSIKSIEGVAAKVIPYKGLSNMISVVAARSNESSCEVDYSLQENNSQNNRSKEVAADAVMYIFTNDFGRNLYEKSTGKPISQYIIEIAD